MHAIKISHGSHQYKKVPLDSGSDSDEAILYTAPSLNNQTKDSFGVGVYDHGRDLELPRVRTLPNKRELLKRKRYEYMAAFFKMFLCLILMAICVVLVSLFIVAVNTGYFEALPSASPSPTCTPVPKPLADGGIQPCGGVVTTAATTAPTTSSGSATHSSPAHAEPPTEAHEEAHKTTPTTANHAIFPHTLPHNEPTASPGEHKAPPTAAPGEHTAPPTVVPREHTAPPTAAPGGHQAPPTVAPREHDALPTVAPGEHQAPPTTSTHSNHPTSETATLQTSNEDTQEHIGRFPSTTGRDQRGPTRLDVSRPPPKDLSSATPTSPEASCFPVPKPLPNQQVLPCPTQDTPATPSPREITIIPSPSTTESTEVKSQSTTGDADTLVSTTADSLSAETGAVVTEAKPSDGKSNPNVDELKAEKSPPAQATPPSGSSVPLFWERVLAETMTETSPELHDVNGDGIDDIIVAVDHSQCYATVIALESRTGSTIWENSVNFAVFAVRCIVDVNGDGTLDCLVSGRSGGFLALNSADGALLWSIDPTLVFSPYNFYFPMVLPDMDNDGVDDIISVHGGDPKYEPSDHERSPAFLVAVSGKTGQKLMERVPMPDGRESYMSPILFTVNQSDRFVLFGSGGETVPGSLWAVELKSLLMRVALYHTSLVTAGKTYVINTRTVNVCLMDPDDFDKVRPVFDSTRYDRNRTMASTPIGHLKCPTLAHKQALWNEYNLCMYEVVRGAEKGVILPPVIVDMTLDGVDDLVVSTYDGGTMVLDGRDLATVVWETSYPDTESYRYVCLFDIGLVLTYPSNGSFLEFLHPSPIYDMHVVTCT